MNWPERWHASHVHPRRVRVLAEIAARMIPPDLAVLDIGCGDGQLAATLAHLRPDLSITGAEVAPRPDCVIPVFAFDGCRLPSADNSFGAALIVDVLHHTENPGVLLREAARVARDLILLKDHLREGFGASATLRVMDEISNRRHGVALPFNYLNRAAWSQLFADCGLVVEQSDPVARLYPFPANLVFGRRLHFLARLRRSTGSSAALPSQP
jgi:SAM-dependent methyltransferase